MTGIFLGPQILLCKFLFFPQLWKIKFQILKKIFLIFLNFLRREKILLKKKFFFPHFRGSNSNSYAKICQEFFQAN